MKVRYLPTTKYFHNFLKLKINMIWHMLKQLDEENGLKNNFTIFVGYKK